MHEAFELGDWLVIPERSVIERDGTETHIKPKSMAVLECLANAGGKVVSRDELFEAVWPGAVVSDDTLTQGIVELRKAFGDTARDARYIETIPKKGFRLVAAVSTPVEASVSGAAGPGDESGKTPKIVYIGVPALGAVVVAALLYWFQDATQPDRGRTLTIEDTQTLAVLPFVDMSPDADQEYLVDGISEELLTRLGRLDDLQVSGRTSSFFFKGKDADLQEISERLNVANILEGSVRRSGDQLRITANLVDTANGFQLWSETYDRRPEDIFAIQDEIAESVATALSIALGVGELGKVVGGTSNIEAYNEALLGSAQYRIYSRESIPIAISHFERAVELDPNYALGWERLADIYTTSRFIADDEVAQNWVTLSGNAIDRALKLAPDSIEIQLTAAFRLTHMEEWREAHLAYERIDAMNGDEDVNMSNFLIDIGRGPDSLEIMLRERQRDPLSGIVAFYIARIYRQMGRLDEAAAEIERGFELGTYRPFVTYMGVDIALGRKNRDEIILWINRQSEAIPTARSSNARMIAMLDDREASLKYLSEYLEHPQVHYGGLAMWAGYYGDHELALRANMRGGGDTYWEPLAAGMRKLHGYKDIVRDMGLVDYWREYGWGYFCKPIGEDDFECF